MSNDKRLPYHRRPTKPLPREELAPVASTRAIEDPPDTRPALEETAALARAAEKEAITMTKCPLCCQGMVSPEIASTFEALVKEAQART